MLRKDSTVQTACSEDSDTHALQSTVGPGESLTHLARTGLRPAIAGCLATRSAAYAQVACRFMESAIFFIGPSSGRIRFLLNDPSSSSLSYIATFHPDDRRGTPTSDTTSERWASASTSSDW